jgi:hypothetical protein
VTVRIAVPVTASPGDEVRVQYALLPPGGAEPPLGSKRWTLAEAVPTGDLPKTAYTPGLITPSRVWIRLSGWEDGRRVTNYTTAESFDLGAQPGLTAVLLTVDDGGGIVTWDPGLHSEEVRVRWAVESDPEASPSWSSPVDVPASPAAFAVPTLPAMGDRVWVELTPLLDSGSTLGTAVVRSEVRSPDYGDAINPRLWMWWQGGIPMRWSDHSLVRFSGASLPLAVYTWSDGRPVRWSDLTLVRSSDS